MDALGHAYGDWIVEGDNHKKVCANGCGIDLFEEHDHDAVVTAFNIAIREAHIAAGIDVDPVVIGVFQAAANGQILYRYIVAIVDPVGPTCRLIDHRNVLKQHIF